MDKIKFATLYNFCQTQSTPISRRSVQIHLEELFPNEKFTQQKVTMNSQLIRGYFLSERVYKTLPNGSKDYYKLHRIVFSKDLNHCWERFVCIKEMMHIFDSEEEKTANKEQLNLLIDELTVSSMLTTPQSKSDVLAFWLALACVCPESQRTLFKQQIKQNQLTTMDIAQKLKIPEQYIPHLLSKQYDKLILQDIVKV